MTSLIRQTVSHDKILEHLGGGGIGIVYKAQDLKLDRSMALKLLPVVLTRKPSAQGRFTSEVQAAPALQHGDICVVHAFHARHRSQKPMANHTAIDHTWDFL